ncbi:MAG TPA: hypothetical protein VGB52_08745 [Actinomycetota bacterium]
MSDPDEFLKDLEALDFRFVQERAGTGVRQYAKEASRWLRYWVHWDPRDASVLFTWEFSIGEYVSEIGLQVGANEELNTFLFPRFDARGTADTAFVVQEMDRIETILRGIDFLEGT